MPLQYDPEFADAAASSLQSFAQAGRAALNDIETRRARLGAILRKNADYPIPENVERVIHHVSSADGHEIPIYHFRRKDLPSASSRPAIVHIHGGGYFSFGAAHSTEALIEYVSKSGVQMLSIDYRLAPECPFPIPLQDCWSALTWIQSQASSLNIDTARIAVMGESAGGGLAANLALMARDRGFSPPIAKQLLIYPMLDDRTQADYTEGFAFWDITDNTTGWNAYLGADVVGTDAVPSYAAAARCPSVEGLPELYMDCGQLDILLPENLKYVGRFVEAKIPTEFHIYNGLPHGFTSLGPNASCSQRAIANRVRAMTTF